MALELEFLGEGNSGFFGPSPPSVSLAVKSLQQMGKAYPRTFCNSYREFMRSLENRRRGPGRPSVDDDTLSSDRDSLVWLLSVLWGEIGWEVPRSTSPDELRQAFGPVRGHSSEHLLALFIRRTPIAATARVHEDLSECCPAQ